MHRPKRKKHFPFCIIGKSLDFCAVRRYHPSMRYPKAQPSVAVILAAVALLLSACETFHYGDKIRYRGAEVALLNYPEEQVPQKTQSHANERELYKLDGKLYERTILTYAPLTHVAAWYRMCPMTDDRGEFPCYHFSSEEMVGAATERQELMRQVYPVPTNTLDGAIPAAAFDFSRAKVGTARQLREGDSDLPDVDVIIHALWCTNRHPLPGDSPTLRDYMASDLPPRKVHPMNHLIGGIVHWAVDIPLDIIVNIINPLDLWHFPESWE